MGGGGGKRERKEKPKLDFGDGHFKTPVSSRTASSSFLLQGDLRAITDDLSNCSPATLVGNLE